MIYPVGGSGGGLGARVGTIVSIDADECIVSMGDGTVSAYLTDNVWASAAIGAVVTLLPVGDTYEVLSTRTGSGGGGGMILGSELLPNNGFEFGLDGGTPDHWDYSWLNEGGAASKDSTVGESLSGNSRYLSVLTPTGAAVDHFIYTPVVVSVDPGKTYEAAVWLKATSPTPGVVCRIQVATATSPTSSTPTFHTAATIPAPGTAYQFASGPITVPAGHRYARFYAGVVADSGASLSVSWDAASLRQRITS